MAPNGIPAVPLPDTPLEFATAEGQNIRVVVVARGMSAPWSMVWLPNGDMLITQRTGQVRRLRNGVLDPAPVAGVPAVVASGLSGLYDIVLHPQFASNQLLYLSYPKPAGPAPAPARLRRPRPADERAAAAPRRRSRPCSPSPGHGGTATRWSTSRTSSSARRVWAARRAWCSAATASCT